MVLCALSAPALATDRQQSEARALFDEGREQYQHEHFQKAYDLFKRAYLLAAKPELLYNMASALRALGRPSDAAEELRAYLRANPTASDRTVVEDQIRALVEAQRLLSPPAVALLSPAPSPSDALREGRGRHRTLVIALSTVGAIVVVGAGLGLGLGFGLGAHGDHTSSTLGVIVGTP